MPRESFCLALMEGYGFDTTSASMEIVRIPFIGMDRRYAIPVATSFPDLLKSLRYE